MCIDTTQYHKKTEADPETKGENAAQSIARRSHAQLLDESTTLCDGWIPLEIIASMMAANLTMR